MTNRANIQEDSMCRALSPLRQDSYEHYLVSHVHHFLRATGIALVEDCVALDLVLYSTARIDEWIRLATRGHVEEAGTIISQ